MQWSFCITTVPIPVSFSHRFTTVSSGCLGSTFVSLDSKWYSSILFASDWFVVMYAHIIDYHSLLIIAFLSSYQSVFVPWLFCFNLPVLLVQVPFMCFASINSHQLDTSNLHFGNQSKPYQTSFTAFKWFKQLNSVTLTHTNQRAHIHTIHTTYMYIQCSLLATFTGHFRTTVHKNIKVHFVVIWHQQSVTWSLLLNLSFPIDREKIRLHCNQAHTHTLKYKVFLLLTILYACITHFYCS